MAESPDRATVRLSLCTCKQVSQTPHFFVGKEQVENCLGKSVFCPNTEIPAPSKKTSKYEGEELFAAFVRAQKQAKTVKGDCRNAHPSEKSKAI